MKKFITLLIGAFGLTLTGYAQLGLPHTVFTNRVLEDISTNVNTVIPMEHAKNIAIQITRLGQVADATNTLKATFSYSNDKLTWFTSPKTMALEGLGTLSASCISNWDIGAIRYLRLDTLNNTAHAVPTNVNVIVIINEKEGL